MFTVYNLKKSEETTVPCHFNYPHEWLYDHGMPIPLEYFLFVSRNLIIPYGGQYRFPLHPCHWKYSAFRLSLRLYYRKTSNFAGIGILTILSDSERHHRNHSECIRDQVDENRREGHIGLCSGCRRTLPFDGELNACRFRPFIMDNRDGPHRPSCTILRFQRFSVAIQHLTKSLRGPRAVRC